MPNELPDNIWERIVGEEQYITIDFSGKLQDGETISSVTFTPVDTSKTTFVSGTDAVYSNGRMVSGKFTHLVAGTYYVNVSAPTSGPTEVVKAIIGFKQIAAAS